MSSVPGTRSQWRVYADDLRRRHLMVACPYCKSTIGVACRGAFGFRIVVHWMRKRAAKEAGLMYPRRHAS